MNAFGLAPLLLILPLLGAIINGWLTAPFVKADRAVGEKWVGWIATVMSLSTFGIAVLIFMSLQANGHHAETIPLFDWINIQDGLFRIQWAFYLDTLSSTMLLVVTGVGSLIHIYAIGYMHGDDDFARFFAYLNLFLFFMLILVTGSSYLMLFVGWEGVGLCSFLLVGFWFSKPDGAGWKNSMAARKAFVANRVGDFAMILAMTLTFWVFGTMEFEPVFAGAIEMFEAKEVVHLPFGTFELGQVLTWITALFLLGATGKSAQIPLFIWLPDAMAGPTPVSALIHAATMVTSGIYLITRSNVLFEIVRQSGYQLGGMISVPDLVALVGATTAVYAGLIAFTQFDVKKVLAYSTVSQLGFMIAAVGMGAYVAAMFHLITHAFFKALLFMGSGSIIHGMEHGHHHIHDHHGHGGDDDHAAEDHHDDFDPQDMRTMGGLRHKMPRTYWTYMVGSLALAGIFPFAGFWSKDEILAHASSNGEKFAFFLVIGGMLTFAAFCTAFYMARQVKMVFFGEGRHEAVAHVPESNGYMTFPLVVLAILALAGGLLNFPNIDAFGAEEQGAAEGHSLVASAEEAAGGGWNLALEHWLEHSIQSFELTAEHIVSMPHTPTSLDFGVAGRSLAIAVFAILFAWFGIFRNYPNKASDEDPLSTMPVIKHIWAFFAGLPIDSLYMKGWVAKVFLPVSEMAERIDGNFWHDYFHNNIIRDSFITIADLFATVADPHGVDGIVNGVGRSIRAASGQLRKIQTGNVGNYALSLFVGVTALVVYFIFAG
ncbi:MAG: NADH-quinone oxidoreductase subunit L [Candidatus Promineifilaceae bacterium]|jgi:NADH-quinone oxidoreductase subunit L